MTTAIRFNSAAAQDALARSDFGDALLPGDAGLIDAYEGYCQQEYGRFEDARYELERLDWLARQCPGCVDGGTGETCDDCWDGSDALSEVYA